MAERVPTAKRVLQMAAGGLTADVLIQAEENVLNLIPADLPVVSNIIDFIRQHEELFPALLSFLAVEIRRFGLLPRELQYVPEGLAAVAAVRAIEKLFARLGINPFNLF